MTDSTPRIIGQRDSYIEALFKIFQQDKNCVFITADNGAPSLDQFVAAFPDRFIQVGIAEQQAIGMAAGMAIEGKRPFVYAIAPFMTTRVHEFVKLDVAAANLPVTILGVGAGHAYDNMGPSHHTLEDISIMRCLPNLEIWSPCDALTAEALATITYERNRPCYIRFDRAGIPDVDESGEKTLGDIEDGNLLVSSSDDDELTIFATGITVHRAIDVQNELLAEHDIKTRVIDVVRIKPFNTNAVNPMIPNCVTLEEHFLAGGLGSIIAETIVDNGYDMRLLRLGRTEENGYCFSYGGRDAIQKEIGLDTESIVKRILEWI